MEKTKIIEKYTLSFGTVIKVLNDRYYSIGNIIDTDEGDYKIVGIIMPTTPSEMNFTLLKVDSDC